jgi:RNA polymerase sigma factor (sigma-70 family)
MNILELDSYNLDDAVKFNDSLNPRLWDSTEHLRPEVHKQLLRIADDFREFLGVPDLDVEDITISGSNAAYTYTPNSDIDLHLVVRMPEDPVYRELFDAKKFQYNEQHDIQIGGYDVELYVQDADQPHISQGIYSLVKNDWVQVPRRVKSVVDDTSTRHKFEKVGNEIERAIASGNLERMTRQAEKIKRMRQTGLEAHGEFGPENLAFKILRKQGLIKELYDARNAAKDRELSLKEKTEKPAPFVYGFRRQVDEVGMSPDGTSPHTCMIVDDTQPTDEDILKDFIDYCIKELKIEHKPTIKLRRDPQWPVVHKTFGRYINDHHLLEVAWGGRHIMDVLRTVAHELTHKHQHERDGEKMGATAGETGSPWENEANARAGILMRDYARLHPEYFAVGQAHDLTEDNLEEGVSKKAAAAALVAALAGDPAAAEGLGSLISLIHGVGSVAMQARNITRAGINAEAQQEITNFIRAQGGDAGSQNLSNLYQLQRELKQQQPDTQPLPGYTQQAEPTNESASGYIPTKKQAEDLKEANPNQQLSLYRPDGTTYRGEKMPVLDPNDFHSDTNPRKRVDQATHQDLANRTAPDLVDPIERTERKIDLDRLKNVIRANMKDLLSTETAVLNMRYWKDLTLEQTAQALGLTPERVRQIEAKALRKLRHLSKSDQLKPFVRENASGYIPTKRQAKDPRFSMALTKDIRPGQLGKEANKLKLRTDSQGHPQVANPNGLFEKLALELAQFKRTPVAESVAQLAEVRMAPSNLKQFANSPEAEGIQAGFEAELIFRDTQRNDDDDYEMEPDYDQDERCRSLGQVVDFFESGDYGLGSRQAERLREQLDEAYYEWFDEQMHRDFKEEAEDLIRKVIVDEGDWDEDNEIQKQLELLDLTNDEMNDIIRAGERAPKFTSSKEQILYAEANPLYQKYLDAQEEAEGLLDDLVADEVRKQGANWDAALDDFRDNYSLDDDSGFFDDAGLRWMSDVAREYDLDWPYMTGGNSGTGSRSWDEIGDSLNGVVDMPVKVSSGYHNATRREGQWIVEPDSSLQPDDSDDMGLEIVSPPMPLLVALNKLQQVTDWANSNEGDAYTNSSTGLHMGVSVPFKGGDVDYLKLILFLGDEYVLKQFGREANTYTKSAMSKFRENIRGGRADPAGAMKLMQSGLIELAHREIQKGVGDGKYTSAHIQKGYIEFRSAGGDWLAEENANPEILQTTMLRYARAMSLAANPSEERREYAKKLYKLVAPEGDSELALFSQYAAGELTAEQLKKRWAEKTLSKEAPKEVEKGEWVVVDNSTKKPVQGQSYNGYTKAEARARAKQKLSPASSDTDFDLAYSVEPQNTGRWEIYSFDPDSDATETLEVVDADNRGAAVDLVWDKYNDQKIPFKVRPYYGDKQSGPEKQLSPRAKLAKRITTPKPKADYNYEIVNKSSGRAIEKLYATGNADAHETFVNWARDRSLDPADYVVRRIDQEVRDLAPDVEQNFTAPQDATEVRRNWEFVDRITGRVIHSMTNASYNQANVVQDNLEQQNPNADIYLRSVANLEENFADGKNPQDKGDSVRHGIPKGATMAELEKASHASGRKGQLARWQLNMRRGKKK